MTITNLPVHAPEIRIAKETKKATPRDPTIMGPHMNACMEATYEFASLLHPKYSTFITGVTLMLQSDSGGYLRGFERSIGFLMLAASTVLEPARLVIGGVGVVAGGLGTVICGTCYGAERMARLAASLTPINHLLGGNKTPSRREVLTGEFARRVQEVIRSGEYSHSERQLLKEYPASAVALAGLSLAFRSRTEKGEVLITSSGERITRRAIDELNEESCSEYFDAVLNLRDDLQQMHLPGSTATAWANLREVLLSLKGIRSNDNLSARQEGALALMKDAEAFANLICGDVGFQTEWERVKGGARA